MTLTIHTVDRVLSGLDALLDMQPALEPTVDFYEELLPLLYAARPPLTGLTLHVESARAKLREGTPLLWGEFAAPTAPGAEPNIELFMTLCRLAVDHGATGGELLMKTLLDGTLDLRSVMHHALLQNRSGLATLAEPVAEPVAIDPALLESVVNLTLSPICWAYQSAFSAAFDYTDWRQGFCPVCGAWPILGELRGRDKVRHLRCGRCGAGWGFHRLQCCWCNSSHRPDLSFLFDESDASWRVDTCDRCRGYLKTKTTFEPLDADLLVVYDLATMGLDELAGEAGYRRLLTQPGAEAVAP